MAIVSSVNVGQPRPIPGKAAMTGIYKQPMEADVQVSREGLEGDAVLDRRHHGGRDQAVYVYSADDYKWWSGELGETLAPGTFGDNLTIAGVEGIAVSPGDRFEIGDVILEVTSHRTPCNVLAARMGDKGFVKRFHQAGRPGAYCRVIEEGTLRAGQPVLFTPFDGERVSVRDLMALEREDNPETMRRALKAPVHHKMRSEYEDKLARLF
ncbi:MOSC domain-containing protein [Devosia aquimaris]|uniref:MOSC domain-containing protein n=1 Tax=Devosia aquimaris TaxID=2866214 RepID=UPI001CD0AD8E|nr:MOSC domain-containing protein [Devosia sp. CJK-A8-3]